ncbi:TrmB family transcriptional regulator [Natronorubrum sp. DTA28]|uniref:TrmB family transcriptional regulator n=1 Tax=Natronorubrum sp. DTA28 TaxID=3447019 RepID=UPI003F85BC5B
MPTDNDESDHRNTPTDHETDAERILLFLAENRDQAFEATEIAAKTDLDENSVRPILERLRSSDLVRQADSDWRIGTLERVRNAFVFHSTVELFNEKYGYEDREEWLAAAADSDTDDE